MRDLRILSRANTDVADAAAGRLAARRAAEQAVAERRIRFPVLTAENIDEALAWQEARIRALQRS